MCVFHHQNNIHLIIQQRDVVFFRGIDMVHECDLWAWHKIKDLMWTDYV